MCLIQTRYDVYEMRSVYVFQTTTIGDTDVVETFHSGYQLS